MSQDESTGTTSKEKDSRLGKGTAATDLSFAASGPVSAVGAPEPAAMPRVPHEAQPGAPAVANDQGFARSLSAFRHRNYTIFWIGALASNTGGWLCNLTVPFILFSLTGSAVWVALATVAQMGPAVFLAPWGGYIADRFERKKVLLLTQSLLAGVGLVLWGVWALGWQSAYLLLGLVCLMGIINAMNMPAWQSFVNDLVPREDLPSAIALNSLQFNAARSLGPAIAGVLLATLGPSWAFFLNAVSFGCVIAALALIKPSRVQAPNNSRDSILRQFGKACSYISTQRGIFLAIILSILVGLLGNPLFQLTVVFADSVFQVGPTELGLMNAALGVGAVLAAPLVAGWSRSLPRSRVVFYSMLAYGIALIVFGMTDNFIVGIVSLLAVGACFMASISGINTAIQMIVADSLRGRVIAVRHMFFMAAMPAGALIQGWIADTWGVQFSVITAGCALFAGTLLLRVLLRADGFARLDDPQDSSRP